MQSSKIELDVLEIEITSDGSTLLRYKDAKGVTHTNFDNLSLEQVRQICTRAGRTENSNGQCRRFAVPLQVDCHISLLDGGARRVIVLDVAMDDFLKEEFGFNKVGNLD